MGYKAETKMWLSQHTLQNKVRQGSLNLAGQPITEAHVHGLKVPCRQKRQRVEQWQMSHAELTTHK